MPKENLIGEIPKTNIVKDFLYELWKRGIIKEWKKVSGNNDEYIIKFNINKWKT